jgi:hypothetical protein
VKSHKWTPELFARISTLPDSPMKRSAYLSARELLGPQDSKLLREWEVFASFCLAGGLAIEPAHVAMLDPNSSNPPPPDLRCVLAGEPHFFELGEIYQQDIAKAWSPTSRAVVVTHDPLVRIADALFEMLAKKVGKAYNPQARPISLLLYYDNVPSFWRFLRPLVSQRAEDLRDICRAGIFDSIYLFDLTEREVLCHFQDSPPSIS